MTIAEYITDLQARGRYTFSYSTLKSGTGKSEKAVERALARLRQQGKVASPRKSFYVIVPPEYRVSGCLPATWFIDDMMGFLGEDYYVGLLSAAEIYGAAHHRPQELQIVTKKSYRSIVCGRSRVRFFLKRALSTTPTIKRKTRTGYMQVSTPEATALDLIRYSFSLGGLSSAAVVISELAEILKPRELVKTAKAFELPVVQRLGFVLDKLNKPDLSKPLSKWLHTQNPRLILLRNNAQNNSAIVDERWFVKVNEELELAE